MQTTQLVMPDDLNPHGNLFGGRLMSWIDKIAAQEAMFITKCNCVTASMDKMDFKAPVQMGDSVLIDASFASRGSSSLKVSVRAMRIHPDAPPKLIGESEFTFVAIKDGKPYKDWKTPVAVIPGGGQTTPRLVDVSLEPIPEE